LNGIDEVDIGDCLERLVEFNLLGNHFTFRFYGFSSRCCDLSMFSKVQHLDIYCRTFVSCDFSCLKDISSSLSLSASVSFLLNLEYFKGTHLFLEKAIVVNSDSFFSHCCSLTKLTLDSCEGVDFLKSPTKFSKNHPFRKTLKELQLWSFDELMFLSSLAFIPKIDIFKCPWKSFINLKGLQKREKGLRKFSLRNYEGSSIDLFPLNGLHSVSFDAFNHFLKSNVLQNIHFLHIKDDLTADRVIFKNIYHLNLEKCSWLSTLNNLINVSIVEVYSCASLSDIDNLMKDCHAKSVKIVKCPGITKYYKEGKYESLNLMIPKFVVIE
jgi:hypothetical protein